MSSERADGCHPVDIPKLPDSGPKLFALRIEDESMIGKAILPGDVVILEHGRQPRNGDVVGAFIGGLSVLRAVLVHKGKPYLTSANRNYPGPMPAEDLVIQGVVVMLMRGNL